jgi:hypothetical protein
MPESFRSLSIQPPLLKATLQRLQAQAEAGRLPDHMTKAMDKGVVDNTSEQSTMKWTPT